MPLAQLAHQVLAWAAVLAAVGVLVLAGAAELRTPAPAAVPADVRAAQAPAAAALAADRQHARERASRDDALGRVQFAAFTVVGLALLMLLAALAGGAPAPFASLTTLVLALSVVHVLLWELDGASVAIAALHLIVAAILLGAVLRLAARHFLLPAPWLTAPAVVA